MVCDIYAFSILGFGDAALFKKAYFDVVYPDCYFIKYLYYYSDTGFQWLIPVLFIKVIYTPV